MNGGKGRKTHQKVAMVVVESKSVLILKRRVADEVGIVVPRLTT